MSKRRRRKSSSSSFSVKKKRSALRTFIETVMGISIGLLIIGGVVWYYFIREEPEVVSNSEVTAGVVKDNVIAQEKIYEIIRDGKDLDEQLTLLNELRKWDRSAETPVRLDTLAKRFEIANVILDNPDLEEEDRVTTARAALQTAGQIYGICLTEGISTKGKVVEDFKATTLRFAGDSNPDVKRDARVGSVKLVVYDNCLTQEDFVAALSQMEKEILDLIEAYPNDVDVLNTVRLMSDRIKARDVDSGNQIVSKIVDKYMALDVSEPEIVARLKGIRDRVTLSQIDLGVLTPEIVKGDQFEDFFNKLTTLIELPDTGIGFANRIYEVVSFLESLGEHEKALRVLDEIKRSLPNRTDLQTKIHLDRIARFGTIRNNAVGKKLNFNDTDSKGDSIDVSTLENRACILAFYSPNNKLSETLLSDLNSTYSLIANSGVKVITIAVEEPKGSRLDLGFHPDWIKIVSVPPKGPQESDSQVSEIFKRIPVSHVPYFVIVGPDGLVRDINVPTNRIKTRVEAVISKFKAGNRIEPNN